MTIHIATEGQLVEIAAPICEEEPNELREFVLDDTYQKWLTVLPV